MEDEQRHQHGNENRVEDPHGEHPHRLLRGHFHVYHPLRKVRPRVGVALPARAGEVRLVHPRRRVGRGEDVVETVARGAVGGLGHPVLQGDPVKGVHVGREPLLGQGVPAGDPFLFVAGGTGLRDVLGENRRRRVADLGDLVLPVAVRAYGRLGDPAAHPLPVDAPIILLQDAGVALPAHRRDVLPVGGGAWLVPREDRMVAVAVRADRSPQQARLLEGHPVDALLVRLHHLPAGQPVLLLDRAVLVALEAHAHDVQAERPRGGIPAFADVVLPVTVGTPCGLVGAFRVSLPVRAPGVGLLRVRVALDARDPLQFAVGGFRAGVAHRAGSFSVHGSPVRLLIDEQRQRSPAGEGFLDRLVAVALHAFPPDKGRGGCGPGLQEHRRGQDHGQEQHLQPFHDPSGAIRVVSGAGAFPGSEAASISSSSSACSRSMWCRESFPSIQVNESGAKSGLIIT